MYWWFLINLIFLLKFISSQVNSWPNQRTRYPTYFFFLWPPYHKRRDLPFGGVGIIAHSHKTEQSEMYYTRDASNQNNISILRVDPRDSTWKSKIFYILINITDFNICYRRTNCVWIAFSIRFHIFELHSRTWKLWNSRDRVIRRV